MLPFEVTKEELDKEQELVENGVDRKSPRVSTPHQN